MLFYNFKFSALQIINSIWFFQNDPHSNNYYDRRKLIWSTCLGKQVTSRKDQEQYWADSKKPYSYISVSEFSKRFRTFHVGANLEKDLSVPYDRFKSHPASLVFKKHSVPKSQLFKVCWDRELLLMKRNAFFYITKTVQIIIMALIASTVYLRTEMGTKNESDGAVYIGALMFSMIVNMFNGFAELALMIQRLPVFYKQRDLLFHPPWTFTLPTFLLGIPISIFESVVWVTITYYMIGFAPELSRWRWFLNPQRVNIVHIDNINHLVKVMLAQLVIFVWQVLEAFVGDISDTANGWWYI